MMTLQKLFPAVALSTACVLGALGLASGQGTPPPSPAIPSPRPLPLRRPRNRRSPKPLARRPASTPARFVDYPAFVVKTDPPTGSTDVDPATKEIRVTFSREMRDGSWSWVTINKDAFPEITGKISYAKDRRTCVAPVKLEPGKTYAIFLNSTKFINFRDTEGRPAVPHLLVFKTRK